MIVEVVAGFVAGALVALVYFELLWLTVREVTQSSNPYGMLLGSFAIRGGLCTVAGLLLASWSIIALVAAAIAFLVVRTAQVRRRSVVNA